MKTLIKTGIALAFLFVANLSFGQVEPTANKTPNKHSKMSPEASKKPSTTKPQAAKPAAPVMGTAKPKGPTKVQPATK